MELKLWYNKAKSGPKTVANVLKSFLKYSMIYKFICASL